MNSDDFLSRLVNKHAIDIAILDFSDAFDSIQQTPG